MLIRTISGAVLLALSFLFIYLGGYPLGGILTVLSMAAYYELTKALVDKYKEKKILVGFGYVAIALMYAGLLLSDNMLYPVMAVVLSIILFLCIYVFWFPKYNAEDVMSVIMSFVYAPVLFTFVYLTRNMEGGIYLVWMIYICSWGYDTFAYLVGMTTGKLFGNHKFVPVLSPKKSIEGLIGGIAAAFILGFCYSRFFAGAHLGLEGKDFVMGIIGAVGALIAQTGDLAASAIKRNKNIKDYGKCIPGHGGIMDRFDSMVFTAPIIYFLAALLIK